MIYNNIFTHNKNHSWSHFHLFPIISNFGNKKSPKSSKNPHVTEKCSKNRNFVTIFTSYCVSSYYLCILFQTS